MAEREVKKIAAEHLRPMNQGLVSIGSATNFTEFVDNVYTPVSLTKMASSTQDRYRGDHRQLPETAIRRFVFAGHLGSDRGSVPVGTGEGEAIP